MVSIIIVNYKVKTELIACIESIVNSKPKVPHEIIVVDNDDKNIIVKSLVDRFSQVKYIKSPKNIGYGAALNKGAEIAKGKYLILLNPDTEIMRESINFMIKKIASDAKIGVLGPKVMNKKGEILQSISNMPFLPDAFIVFSFLNKLWPFNLLYKKYHRMDFSRDIEQEVEVVGGVCMVVRKSVFEKVGGFDKRFFMYFEEVDFCYRVRQLGYKVVFYPKAKIIHLVGRSMQDKEWIKKTFEKSRFDFFRKYHGLLLALIGETILRTLNIYSLLLFIILALSLFLNTYRLSDQMVFIGDQGWFYLSARDMLLTGNISLVGIASSHPWLHQGPLWTYILALIFWIFKFNPVAPAYFTAILGIVTVFLIYKVGSELFSKKVGLIAAALYATSPLIIMHSRMPYHTSPIPFFTLLFIYALYKWIKGNPIFFPLVILFLAILYNLELFTAVLWFIVFIVLIFGFMKKKKWLLDILNKKILIFSLFSFIIPMIPILIYDFQNGFTQTVKFIVWMGYRILRVFGFPSIHGNSSPESMNLLIETSASYIKKLIFLPNETIAIFIFILSFGFFFRRIYLLRRGGDVAYIVLGLTIIISFLGYIVNKIPSEAYISMFFPLIIFVIALFFDYLTKLKFLKIYAALLLMIIMLWNIGSLVSQNYLVKQGYSFAERLNASQQIIKLANKREYNLVGRGKGSQFESFTMNYEYLAWWLGNGPSSKNENLKFYIWEDEKGIHVQK